MDVDVHVLSPLGDRPRVGRPAPRRVPRVASLGVECVDGRKRVPGKSEQAGLRRADMDRIGHREAGGPVAPRASRHDATRLREHARPLNDPRSPRAAGRRGRLQSPVHPRAGRTLLCHARRTCADRPAWRRRAEACGDALTATAGSIPSEGTLTRGSVHRPAVSYAMPPPATTALADMFCWMSNPVRLYPEVALEGTSGNASQLVQPKERRNGSP
jgi:hypothetical protein